MHSWDNVEEIDCMFLVIRGVWNVETKHNLRPSLLIDFGPNAPPFCVDRMEARSTFEASLLRDAPVRKSACKTVVDSSEISIKVPPLSCIRAAKSASVPLAKIWPLGQQVENRLLLESTKDVSFLEVKHGEHALSYHGDLPTPDSPVVTTWHRGRVCHSGLLGVKIAWSSLFKIQLPNASVQPKTWQGCTPYICKTEPSYLHTPRQCRTTHLLARHCHYTQHDTIAAVTQTSATGDTRRIRSAGIIVDTNIHCPAPAPKKRISGE